MMKSGMKQDSAFRAMVAPLLSVVGAFLVGTVIIGLLGEDPLVAYAALINGALGDVQALANTLQKATPYIFGGLAVMIASKCGMFNIGVEGQMYVGAMAAAWAGFTLTYLGRGAHIIAALLIAGIAGGIWSFVPAILKVRFGVNEVIGTLMLNYIAYSLTGYLTVYVFKEPGVMPQTVKIADTAALSLLVPPSRLNTGFLISIALVAVTYVLVYRTLWGYNLRTTGANPAAARYSGVNVSFMRISALLVSGVLAGLMGAERSLGVYSRFISSFSPGYGFTSIAVSLLGRDNPFGILIAAIFFGILEAGGPAMSIATEVPRELLSILQAIIIIFVASGAYISKMLSDRRVSV